MEKLSDGRFESFSSSLSALEEMKTRDLSDSFVMSGSVSKFSLTFDLAWKVMKDIITNYYADVDFAAGSPREVLKKAFSYQLIDSDDWLEMLSLRNALTHDYDYEIAQHSVQKIQDDFLPLLEEFQKKAKAFF